jgi:hypothetical protein
MTWRKLFQWNSRDKNVNALNLKENEGSSKQKNDHPLRSLPT